MTVRFGTPQADPGAAAEPVAVGALEKIEINTDYSDREGYNPAFLGGGNHRVPLPRMTQEMVNQTAENLEPAEGIHCSSCLTITTASCSMPAPAGVLHGREHRRH